MSIFIKNGRMAELKNNPVMNLLIEAGVITYIGEEERVADQVIDAAGCLLLPGFIDAHTHFDMDTGTAHTADDFYTGTKAALSGGTTTIIDFATQNKGETLQQAVAHWHHKASGKCSCDYGFHMAITDWNQEIAKELIEMAEAGVTSFKLYLAYDALRVTDRALYQVLRQVRNLGGIVGVHCENGDLVNELIKEQLDKGHTSPKAHPASRPDVVEKEAINRFLDIAYLAEAPAHIVHLSTKLGLDEVRRARGRGQQVYVETCPQYLLLDETYYDLEGFESAKYVLSPPLRSQENQDALWQALQAGEIDTISTDHCSFRFVGQKDI
ncbi:MAG: dihydropyrimidinase, partial [Cellulosilyticaceae bacterium]